MTLRQEKLNTLFKKLIAQFLQEEIEHGLVTITSCTVMPNLRSARASLAVYPEKMEEKVLALVEEKQRDLRDFLKKNTRIKIIPIIIFSIDRGEQYRQKITDLLNS